MSVTVDDGFSGIAPRVSREGFRRYLIANGSPVVDERDPGEYYDAAAQAGVEPAFLLGMFREESTLGTAGMATITHAWGNMRNPPTGGVPFTEVDGAILGRNGSYLGFDDWLAGCRATIGHLNAPAYRGLTIAAAIQKWAPPSDGNNPAAYARNVVDVINTVADTSTDTGGGVSGGQKMRVILSAGHENIGNIGPEKGINVAALRSATGALGTEATVNREVVDVAASLLRAAGVDVVTTDAIFHPEVYDEPADLLIFVHHDGVSEPRGQWSGAAAVVSGNSTEEADAVAQRFVDAWKEASPRITGITDTHIVTDGMTGYYGGWYRTRDTPAALVECSIYGAGSQEMEGVNTGKEGHAIAEAAAVTLGIKGVSTDVSGSDTGTTTGGGSGGTGDGGSVPVANGSDAGRWADQPDGSRGKRFSIPGSGEPAREYFVGHGFGDFYRANGFPAELGADPDTDPSPIFGYPLTDEFTYPDVDGAVTLQVFQRAVFEARGEQITLRLVGRDFLNKLDPNGVRPANAWMG